MVDDRHGGDRVRPGGEAQIHRAIEASILAAICSEPCDHARAPGAEVERQPPGALEGNDGLTRDSGVQSLVTRRQGDNIDILAEQSG